MCGSKFCSKKECNNYLARSADVFERSWILRKHTIEIIRKDCRRYCRWMVSGWIRHDCNSFFQSCSPSCAPFFMPYQYFFYFIASSSSFQCCVSPTTYLSPQNFESKIPSYTLHERNHFTNCLAKTKMSTEILLLKSLFPSYLSCTSLCYQITNKL